MNPKSIHTDTSAPAKSNAITDVGFRPDDDPRAQAATELVRRSAGQIDQAMSVLATRGVGREQWIVLCGEDRVEPSTRDLMRRRDPDLYFFAFGEGAQPGRVPIVVGICEGPDDRGFFAVIWVEVHEV